MTKRRLNIAMIGYGFMGRAHSNAFHQAPHFFDLPYELRLTAICGRNRSSAEAMAAQWGWAEVETNWEAIITRKDIDVIDICTPNHMHASIAIAAAEAGKIVFCEKPLATTLVDAERMATAARGSPTLVWFNYRRVPAVALAKQLIDDGGIGKAYHYRATYLQTWGPDPSSPDAWRFKKSEAGTGAMGDLLAHSIDLALLLNGRMSAVSGLVKTFALGREVDDAALMLTRFANGSVGTLEATRYATGCRNRNYFEIHGSKGALRFDLEDMNRLEFFDGTDSVEVQGSHKILVTGPKHPYTDHFWPPGHVLGYEHTFILTLADFLHCLASNQPFHPNFDDGAEVQRVLHAVMESSEKGSWVSVSGEAT